MADFGTRERAVPNFVVAQLGARMHYAVPRILHAAGRLERLYTDMVGNAGWPRLFLAASPGSLLPDLRKRLAGRAPRGVPRERIVQFPGFALRRFRRQRAARSATDQTAAFLWAGGAFSRRVVRRGLGRAGGVYGFSSEALELLRFAKERGLCTVVEQVLLPWGLAQRLVCEERRAWTGWDADSEDDALAEAAASRERQEWDSADMVLCASDFVAQGIQAQGGPIQRCRVVPYGVDAVSQPPRRRCGGALRVLFCGAVGLRKGIQYLHRAAQQLPADRFHFRVVGPVMLSEGVCREVARRAELTGAVPRSEMLAHYLWADVFVLPTLCEGSATVCYEALAAGLPVITTPNAGSVVRDGTDGFIVPIREAGAIAEKLELLASQPGLRERMSHSALARAQEYTLERYGERLLAALEAAETGRRAGGNM